MRIIFHVFFNKETNNEKAFCSFSQSITWFFYCIRNLRLRGIKILNMHMYHKSAMKALVGTSCLFFEKQIENYSCLWYLRLYFRAIGKLLSHQFKHGYLSSGNANDLWTKKVILRKTQKSSKIPRKPKQNKSIICWILQLRRRYYYV